MPELPEVEVARRGIRPLIEGRTVIGVAVRSPRLRLPFDPQLASILEGLKVTAVDRRGKYLLLRCEPTEGVPLPPDGCRRAPRSDGWLIVHLGMSGSLRWLPAEGADHPAGRHDHFDLVFTQGTLRLNDPRRFGVVAWQPGRDAGAHPLLSPLGLEPFAEEFDGSWLHDAFRSRHAPVKTVLMDSHTLVGVGNIYASESLFRAGISPLRAADRIAPQRCDRLAGAIRETLAEAIAAGGSSIRDYVHADGGAGCFQVDCAVYERGGLNCRRCRGRIRHIRQAGRSTYYCPSCQR